MILLQSMLKKNPPPWGKSQTKTVVELKETMPTHSPLKIPSTRKRILQNDASDEYWAIMLFEETDGKRHLCAYKSEKNFLD